MRFLQAYRRLVLMGVALLLCTGTGASAALAIPPSPSDYVHDGAQILDPVVRSRLSAILSAEDKRSGNQVLVATFPGLQGEEHVDFVTRLFQAWKPGTKDQSNGVILAIFQQDRKIRIEVGYGLEPLLTDAKSKRIIEGVIKPRFREGRQDLGLIEGAQAIVAVVSGEPVRGTPESDLAVRVKKNFFILLPMFIVFWIIVLVRGRRRWTSPQIRRRSRNSWDGPDPWGGFSGWGGSSGGGFGGFSGGGGMSGGGGASGDW